jgi:hypothetical protein
MQYSPCIAAHSFSACAQEESTRQAMHTKDRDEQGAFQAGVCESSGTCGALRRSGESKVATMGNGSPTQARPGSGYVIIRRRGRLIAVGSRSRIAMDRPSWTAVVVPSWFVAFLPNPTPRATDTVAAILTTVNAKCRPPAHDKEGSKCFV